MWSGLPRPIDPGACVMNNELGYSYRAVCAILDAKGWNEKQIGGFLVKHQNAAGYIRHSVIVAAKANEF